MSLFVNVFNMAALPSRCGHSVLPLCYIFSFFLLFSASNIRDALASQHEVLLHDFAYVGLSNALATSV